MSHNCILNKMISRGFASTQGGVILWEDGFTLINGLKKNLKKIQVLAYEIKYLTLVVIYSVDSRDDMQENAAISFAYLKVSFSVNK